MVSQTVKNIIPANSVHINNLVYDLKNQGKDIIVMSLGEAFFDIPLFDFKDLPYPAIYHYSHSRGILELRQKLSEYFSSQYDVSFNPDEEIIITAGSKVAIYMVFLSILNEGDEVIIPEPYWVSYTEQVKLCNGKPVTVPHYESIFNYEKYINSSTKCIVMNNPNNPSGKVYSEEEIKFLLDLCKKHNLYLLSDEAYSDFVIGDDKFHSLGKFDQDYKNSIICNSISKNYGISGWRLGYVISNEDFINTVLKVNQHLITCPATILEYYIAKYFYEIIDITKPQIKAVVEKRQKVAKYMDEIGLKYLSGTSTFYFLVSIEDSKLNSHDFAMKLLEEYNVSTVPGIGYGKSCDKHIRVGVGAESWERTIRAIDCIKDLITKTK